MLEESVAGKAFAAAKAAGLAINPVAVGILLGATVSVMAISKSAALIEKTRESGWDWWHLIPISPDAMPEE